MIRYTLRIPDALYECIKASAKRERRSIHAQILWLLSQALDYRGDDDK